MAETIRTPPDGIAAHSPDVPARRNRRRARLLLWALVVLLLVGLGWIMVTGLLARAELVGTRNDLSSLRAAMAASSGPVSTAERGELAARAVRSAAGHAGRAHWLTAGPAWYMAAHLPWVGGPFESVRGAAGVLDRLAGRVLPAALRAVDRVSAGTGSGHIDLVALRRAAPELERASHESALALAEAGGLPKKTWLPAVDQARGELLAGVRRVAPVMENAAVGARLLPAMLGESGPRRYFLVFQNPAEARGTGGMPGSYAVLTADKGTLALPEFGRDTDMAAARPKVDLGAEFAAMYGQYGSVGTWPNSNMSPHFPYAARIWSAAWQSKSGEHVDGVVSLDPGALAGLLAAVGPARMTDGTQVTAANVVDLTERTNYVLYPDPVRRKAFLLDVARAAAGRLLAAAGNSQRRPALLRGLYKVLRTGQMTVWSAHGDEQRELAARPVGGSLPEGPGAYAGLVVNNSAGTKLDYYLDRRMEWSAGRCTAAGREVTVTAVFTNRAPSTGLPPYVTDRLDKPTDAPRPGDNRLLVSYFATAGAGLLDAHIDGKTALSSPGTERGHPVYTFDVEVPRGRSRALTLHLLEPPTVGAPVVLRQQLTRPLEVVVRPGPRCGGGGA
ncbi:DUF4012 domain-containing protein [Streptomyces sp. NPDC052040]|uniref:DUF4012 domain-containing protein n=1 Tax=unclassified Streptomyces TaxID=2593676 RepID=UPI0037CCCF54